jgi:hypothetical protein
MAVPILVQNVHPQRPQSSVGDDRNLKPVESVPGVEIFLVVVQSLIYYTDQRYRLVETSKYLIRCTRFAPQTIRDS